MEIIKDNLEECLYDRAWCAFNGIDYVNPDVEKAKQILGEERILKTYKPKKHT